MKFIRDAWPVVVIVGTITGTAWAAAWNIRDFLTTQIAASETRLTARIAESEARLTALDNRLTQQIAESETRLTAQIAELRQLFVDHLEDHANAR
jgi:hypothetical protein